MSRHIPEPRESRLATARKRKSAELPDFRSCNPAWRAWSDEVAEREGFEPSIRFCRILTFQASAFDHSATAPHRTRPVAAQRRA
jgi:hypothetical protein